MGLVTLLGNNKVNTSEGGAAPTSGWDTRVTEAETFKGEFIEPRAGNYFLRSALHYEKNYLPLNGNVKDRPRSIITIGSDSQDMAFDEAYWLGFSIYLPKSWEHENGVTDQRGAVQVLAMNTQASSTLMQLEIYSKTKGHNHWYLQLQTNSNSHDEDHASTRKQIFDLGPVTDDLGKWTDFAILVRSNPFTRTTNPAKAGLGSTLNQTFQGNQGIFKFWKTTGANRKLEQMVNIENAAVGLVPKDDTKIRARFRVYKYGWKSNPSTVKGPVWVGFDEIKMGAASDGIQLEDVVPSSAALDSGKVPTPPAAPNLSID